MQENLPKIGYYYGDAVYTDEDPNTGICHTRYESLESCNRGCTKLVILDVTLVPHRWHHWVLTVRYPKDGGTTWGLNAHAVRRGKWRRRAGHIGFEAIGG